MTTDKTAVSGDIIQGDKFSGDKIAGNKIETQTYIERQIIVQGVEISDLEQLPPEPGEPPYKGLAYFTANDHEWFFGREKITAVLVNRLHDLSFLAVVGDSGSGKSSLVRAGVIPVITRNVTLADGTVPPLGQWRVATLTPTAQPLAKLAATLFPDNHAQQAIIQEQAIQNSRTLHDGLAAQSKPGHKLLLVVDQFEEIFTLCEKEETRQAFINNLLTLAERSADIKLIITLRADFYAQCLRYEGLRHLLKTSQELLGAMSSQELATAILEPAAKGSWQFQAGLVEEILDDVGEEPGRLPLLSHALLETWQRRRGRVLTLSGYQEAGKVRGAIAQTADAVYKALSDDEQKIAQRIFLRLTELGAGTQDTRRRVSQTELGEDAAVKAVTKTLTDARLITASETAVDVSHEALIREWPRLRGWLDADREGLLIHRRLTNGAKTWAEEDQHASYLYIGLRLGEAAQWAQENSAEMNEQEQTFLNASLQAEKQGQRNRRWLQVGTAVLVSILIMALIGSFLISGQRNEAITARNDAETAEETAVAAKATSDINAELAVDAQATSDINAELANAESLLAIEAQETAVAAKATSDANAALAATSEAEARVAEAQVSELKDAIQANQLALSSEAEIERNPQLALLLATTGLGINNIKPDIQARFYNAIFAPYRLTLNGHTDAVNSAVFNSAGNLVLTASMDGTAKLWDILGIEITSLEGHTDWVNSALFNPAGDMILTASMDGTAKLWDTLGIEIASLEGHTDVVNSAVFNPAGDMILTASADRTAKLWDLQGNVIVSLEGHTDGVFSAIFNPSGKLILTTSNDGTAKLWDLQGNEIVSPEEYTDRVSSALFNPAGDMILIANWDGTAKLWDLQGNEIASLEGHTGGITSAVFNPAGDIILTASLDGTAKLWNMQGNETASLEGHRDWVNLATFNPSGKLILTTSRDGTAKLWDIQGNEITSFEKHTNVVNSALFNPTGDMILTASNDGTAKLWDTQGNEMASFEGHTNWIRSAVFNPAGNMILTASWNGTAKLWDTVSNEIASFDTNGVRLAVFNPTGDVILTASWDGTSELWDTQGNEIISFEGHTEWVNSALSNSIGNLTTDNGTTDEWDIYPTLQSKVDVAQELLWRSGFTDAECARYFSDDRDSCPQTVEAVFALFADDLASP